MKNILMSAVLIGLLAACSTPVKDEPKPAVEERTPVTAQPTGGTQQPPVQPPQTVKQEPLRDPLKDPKSPLAKRSVYFEFDRFDIQDQYKPVVEAHARHLVATPVRKVLIQGNCDERGSREYNLALGQKRADAMKRSMLLLGAKEAQIESVSLGEEKPRALGKDEAAWAENRRGDILYNGEF
jgi:peptidoglycan-associated lipoprotein